MPTGMIGKLTVFFLAWWCHFLQGSLHQCHSLSIIWGNPLPHPPVKSSFLKIMKSKKKKKKKKENKDVIKLNLGWSSKIRTSNLSQKLLVLIKDCISVSYGFLIPLHIFLKNQISKTYSFMIANGDKIRSSFCFTIFYNSSKVVTR